MSVCCLLQRQCCLAADWLDAHGDTGILCDHPNSPPPAESCRKLGLCHVLEDAAAALRLIQTELVKALIAAIAASLIFAAPSKASLLPCPLAAGWRVERHLELPRRDTDNQPIGGFSAVHRNPTTGELLLLSDLPQGSLLRWSSFSPGGTPRLLRVLPLLHPMDGEGLVALDGQFWIASEGRRTAHQEPSLLRFDAASGRLLQRLLLPPDWQAGNGKGLDSNAGPESLALMPPMAGQSSPVFLMAAEQPLLQDPPLQVRLLRWQWRRGQDPHIDAPWAQPLGSLQLPGEGWGLTDLMVVNTSQVLALLRRFEAPLNWSIRLALFPLPAPETSGLSMPLAPLASWDLIASGLPPDNWEGITAGPPSAEGQPSLLLVSDDNLNPLQASRLALLTPVRTTSCSSLP